MRRRENIFQICLHKGRDHTKREQLSAYLLIQNRLQYFFFFSFFLTVPPPPPLTPLAGLSSLHSPWFHTLRPNIGADMSRNKTAGIVSPQAIASAAVILASPPPPQPPPSLHRGLGRTNSALTSAGLTALISSLIGQPLCLS